MKCKTCGLEVAKRQITEKGCQFCRGLKLLKAPLEARTSWAEVEDREYGDQVDMMAEFFRVVEIEEAHYDGTYETLYDRFKERMKWNQRASWIVI